MKRKDIHVVTLNKIKKFLKEQTEPVFRSYIVRKIGVDYDSVNFALNLLEIKTNDKGQVSIKNKRGKNANRNI